MRHQPCSRRWVAAGALLVLGAWFCWAAGAIAAEPDLSYYRQAKINWRQFEGQKLTIGLNKHPYTESLLPLIPEFEALTGVKVDYLILPENEYGAKLTADLSNQRGEFTVIMAGAMRNWAYVPPGWMVPLEQFLNDPKLTDKSWYKLEDFFPSLIAANRWNGKVGGGTGEGPLWSIPVMCESYVLAYRKDIFDKYKLAVPATWADFATQAAKLHAANPAISMMSYPSNFVLVTMGLVWQGGARMFDYANGKWYINFTN
ncbi:MAG TPA: extracellular solute-binding protein, partial [Thermodesulfobacteriota bacterium]|nr:extracellular solute-binding protein [Thermodesulfobacteriota bacterium]